MYRLFLIGLLSFLFLSSCSSSFGADQQQGGEDYTKVKEITLDVLHTEEGKKVLLSLLADPEIQQKMVITKGDLEKILAKSISDQKTKKDWETILTKEQVAEQIVKATENQQKQLMKTLIKDPEYQKMLLNVLRDPQFTQHLLSLMNSPTYRKEAMKIIEEIVKTPSFQQKIQQMMQSNKQNEEEQQQGESEQKENEQQQDQTST